MPPEQLRFLQQFHPVSSHVLQLISEQLQPRFFKKGELPVRAGQTQRELYFVESGIQLAALEANGKTHVVAFTYAPGICAIPSSFTTQLPSQYILKCVTDSHLHALPYTALQNLLNQLPEVERLFRKMAEAVLAGVIDRHVELQALTMEERYLAFARRSPHLLQAVPHKYIASYLNIDATNFSKLYNTVKI